MELMNIQTVPNNNLCEDHEISLNLFIAEKFDDVFKRHTPQTYTEIKIESDLEELNVENILKIFDYFSNSGFVLHIWSIKTKSSTFYWRVRNKKRVYTLKCEKEDFLCDFVKKFLLEKIQKNVSGILPELKLDEQQLIIPIDPCLIGDERGFNLLFLAAEAGNINVTQFLIRNGMNVSCLVEGKIPADIAYEKKYFDVLLCLLMANSRFPRDFDKNQNFGDEKLKNFIEESTNLRDAVLNENHAEIKDILNSKKNLRYFYSYDNESILKFALVNKKLEIYELLLSFNLSFGSREDHDEIFDLLDDEEQRSLKKLHLKSSRKVTDKHLMILMANSTVAYDNFEAREKLSHIYEAFEFINKIPVAQSILKVVAARRDFEIHFDFNRDSVRFLDPSAVSNMNGLFYLCGRILIGAKGLLYPEFRNEVCGVMIHEMTHFAMCLVYENKGKPYRSQNLDVAEHFENVSKICESRMELEPIVESVFEDYDEKMHHTELIVRSPQLLVEYSDDQIKLTKCKEDFKPLHEFFEHQVVPDVEDAIPRIENEAKEAYEKALKKISRLKKALWFLFGFLIFSCTALVLLLYEPTYSWSGLSMEDQSKILNSVVTYKGIDVELKYLMANDSDGFNFFNSSHIKDALNGDLSSLSHALNTNLDQYIYLNSLNITEGFWDKILESTVNFQGQEVVLNQIASNTSSLNGLTSHQIKNLLSNESISIGREATLTSFYIPRKFTNSLKSALNHEEIFGSLVLSRIFCLADAPGSGKSVAFEALNRKFTELHPEYWIELVELKNHIDGFINFNGKVFEFVADKILKLNKLERDLFADRFEDGKVILLWDGVDEIAPVADEIFLSLASEIYQTSENIQLISTRAFNADKLTKVFNVSPYSLLEYSKDDRNKFIKEYLESEENLTKSESSKVFEHIEKFIENILSKETSSLRKDINNPLMLKLLAKIAIDNKLSEDLDNIYKVFDTFVNLKLEAVHDKGSNVNKIALILARKIRIDDIHTIHALKLLFGNSFDNILNNTQILTNSLSIMKKENDFMDFQLSSYGILTIFNNKVDFVHRTFAEFFVARYLIESIYENVQSQPEELSKQIALLHNVAYNGEVRKVIQEFISYFLLIEDRNEKRFDEKVINAFKFNITTLRDFFGIQESAPLFLKFFEKDQRIMRIMVKVDAYKSINDWLDVELGISLDNKTSFIENNQLGFILLKCWQFERKGNKIFADFIRNSTNILEESKEQDFKSLSEIFQHLRNILQYSHQLSTANTLSEFFDVASQFLTSGELKQIFMNSLYVIDEKLKDQNQSDYFMMLFKSILNHSEIKSAISRSDHKNETFFLKTLSIPNEALNNETLELIEENLSDHEIFELFTKPVNVSNTTLMMIAAENQDYYFLKNLIAFTKNHTTSDQFKFILLQRDFENDTMLQYAHLFEHPDNFVLMAKIYKEILSLDEVRKTFTERKKTGLVSFAGSFKSTNDNVLLSIALFFDDIFYEDDKNLFDLLSRRNENGDTIFSLYKNEKRYEKKLKPFFALLNITLMSLVSENEIPNIIHELGETNH